MQKVIVTCILMAMMWTAGAQQGSGPEYLIDLFGESNTVSEVLKNYVTGFATVKDSVTYESKSQKKWLSKLCLPGAMECQVNYYKIPVEALYWRCKILQTDTLSTMYRYMVRAIDRIKKAPKNITGTFESTEAVPAEAEISDSYIHIMKLQGYKDARYKDVIAAVTIARSKFTGLWTMVIVIGKTQYEF